MSYYIVAIVIAAIHHGAIADDPPHGEAAIAFPAELTHWRELEGNPVFLAEGAGHWDVKIRERGWILRDERGYRLWFTGYDGTREGLKMLGHATSDDGLHWTRWPGNPLDREHWIEDMQVVREGDGYTMVAEGRGDRAQQYTSADGIQWTHAGPLDVRYVDGRPLSAGPYGTPVLWVEEGLSHLFYERWDLGIWHATSRDRRVWTHVQDEPVLKPGPGDYDDAAIAMNQIVKLEGVYFAILHGASKADRKNWSTSLAASRDLRHWTKYAGNPILRDNKSSGVLVHDGQQYRLYTMHDQVRAHVPAAERSAAPRPPGIEANTGPNE